MGAISPDHENLKMTMNDAIRFGLMDENRQVRRQLSGAF